LKGIFRTTKPASVSISPKSYSAVVAAFGAENHASVDA